VTRRDRRGGSRYVAAVRVTVVTWNLKGSVGVDVQRVSAYVRDQGADVVALQEIQRRQSHDLARALDVRSHRWALKHWPLPTRAEGMAIMGLDRPVSVDVEALTRRWELWNWRRRIMLLGTFAADAVAARVLLLNLHLSPHSAREQRDAEVARVAEVVRGHAGPVIVAGDLNERPDGPVHDRLVAAGLRDAWPERPGGDPGGGETNWHGWDPQMTTAPSQRLDYVYVSEQIRVLDVRVPKPDDDVFDQFVVLSDHLPVTAVLDVDLGAD
jgi:endonuclease/exonuclease/phosphatase family metal-dependent hydrolase